MEENKTFMFACFNSYNDLVQASKNGFIDEKGYHNLDSIARNIIKLYLDNVEITDFSKVIEKFKRQYINGESRIENNETKEEKAGIGIIYDHICNYDFNSRSFNIFVNSMDIHTKLYSQCVGKEFGGALRTEQALLVDTIVEVVPPKEAMLRFNAYIGKSNQLMEELDKLDIFGYIDGCLRIMVDLIKLQPFADGNKRTFRSLFNLMLKRKNLPPVYIGDNSKEFHEKLLKAMVDDDFTELNNLYIRLICDSIVSLGLKEAQLETKGRSK